MDRTGDLPRRGPQTAGQRRLGEHLGHAGSYQMRPDQLAVGVESSFTKPSRSPAAAALPEAMNE